MLLAAAAAAATMLKQIQANTHKTVAELLLKWPAKPWPISCITASSSKAAWAHWLSAWQSTPLSDVQACYTDRFETAKKRSRYLVQLSSSACIVTGHLRGVFGSAGARGG